MLTYAKPNSDSKQKTIAIDFDGVIHNQADRELGKKMGKPYPLAKTCIEALIELGYRVEVYTANHIMTVQNWLEFFDIPYHKVTNTKSHADLYIDNKAYRHTDWQTTMTDMPELLNDPNFAEFLVSSEILRTSPTDVGSS